MMSGLTWARRGWARLVQAVTTDLNLLAPPVRSKILIIVQADGQVHTTYDHPRTGEDVVMLIEALGAALKIVADAHGVPLGIRRPDGSVTPIDARRVAA